METGRYPCSVHADVYDLGYDRPSFRSRPILGTRKAYGSSLSNLLSSIPMSRSHIISLLYRGWKEKKNQYRAFNLRHLRNDLDGDFSLRVNWWVMILTRAEWISAIIYELIKMIKMLLIHMT